MTVDELEGLGLIHESIAKHLSIASPRHHRGSYKPSSVRIHRWNVDSSCPKYEA